MGVEFGGCRIVKDFSEVKGDVTQISAISAGDMNIPAKEILPLWQDRIGAAITGEHWLDFTAAGKDKGLHLLCAHFGIPQENTYAFGDSYNDAPMLRAAAHPYLMNIAPTDLKAELLRFKVELHSLLTKAEIFGFSAHDFQIIQERRGILCSCAFYDKQSIIFIFAIFFCNPRYRVFRKRSCSLTTAKTCSTLARTEDWSAGDKSYSASQYSVQGGRLMQGLIIRRIPCAAYVPSDADVPENFSL